MLSLVLLLDSCFRACATLLAHDAPFSMSLRPKIKAVLDQCTPIVLDSVLNSVHYKYILQRHLYAATPFASTSVPLALTTINLSLHATQSHYYVFLGKRPLPIFKSRICLPPLLINVP